MPHTDKVLPIRVCLFKTNAGVDYSLQADREAGIITLTVRGQNIPMASADSRELVDVITRFQLWVQGIDEDPVVPRT